MGINKVLRVIWADFANRKMGAAIKATTAGRTPLKMLSTTGLSLKEVKTDAISRMIRKEGSTAPRLAKYMPDFPLAL